MRDKNIKKIICPHGISPKTKCKRCLANYSKKYREKYPNKIKDSREKWMVKNPELNKECKRKYAKLHKPQHNKHEMDIYYILRNEVLKVIGSKCIISDAHCDSLERICFHEIHGEKHPKGKTGLRYMLKHKDDFVPLCSRHHILLHNYIELLKNQFFRDLVSKMIDGKPQSLLVGDNTI